jgi:glycosyl transferase family 87
VSSARQAGARGGGTGGISAWSWAAIGVVLALVVWQNAVRFEDPVGDKLPMFMKPGSADFAVQFLGAYAMLSGEDPYRTTDPRFADPWARGYDLGDGVLPPQVYPPTHFLILAPLVELTGGDYRQAGRIWFKVNLLLLGLLAVVTWRSMLAASDLDLSERALRPALLAVPAIVLPLSVTGWFVLERGQSDGLTALMCWLAAACAARDRPALAMFLAMGSALLKGYGVLFALGLFFAFDRPRLRRAALGAAASVAVLLLPVARYLPTAFERARDRATISTPAWFNHSFYNLTQTVLPGWETAGQWLLTALALLATLACWIRARRTLRSAASIGERTRWLTLFTLASLAAVIGYLPSSFAYNLILILPGTLILAFGQRRLVESLGLGRWGEWALGATLVAALVCFQLYKVGTQRMAHRFAPAAVGLVVVTAIAGACGAIALRRADAPEPAAS